MSRTKRNVKNVKNFRNLRTSPHQLNKKLVEKNKDKIAGYACDDFKVAALNETPKTSVKWVREKDGTLTLLRNGEFIVNVTETEKPLFSQWWKNVQNKHFGLRRTTYS